MPNIIEDPIIAYLDLEYTPEEERQARRATDFKLLPFICLCFLWLQFDRTNLGNALTGGFRAEMKLSQDQINLGQVLFTLGIVLLELPANMLSKLIGPNIVVPALMAFWGSVTLSQAFIKNVSSFYATRFLLAAGEAGFIPSMTFFLLRFYKAEELGLRFAIFWSSNNIAGIFSGILALGLLSLNGKGGLFGWQYLFLIEGALTVAVGFIALLYLPYAPFDGRRSRFARGPFSTRQLDIIAARTIKDDPTKAVKRGTPLKLVDIRDTFADYNIYAHCAAAFLSSVMLTPINTYGPSLVKSLGFAGYSANGLQAPGSALALIVSITLAWNSDRTRERGLHVATGMTISGVGALWLALAPTGATKAALYAGYVLTQGGMGTAQGINAAWMTSRIEERKRPVALAAYVMSIQCAGFAGSNIFKAKDSPRYQHGLLICAGCVLGAAVLMVATKFAYLYLDNKKSQKDEEVSVVDTISTASSEKKA